MKDMRAKSLGESEQFVRIDMQQQTYQTKLLFSDLGEFFGQAGCGLCLYRLPAH